MEVKTQGPLSLPSSEVSRATMNGADGELMIIASGFNMKPACHHAAINATQTSHKLILITKEGWQALKRLMRHL